MDIKKLLLTAQFLLLFTSPSAAFADTANHLVISEIQTKGAVADDEFIELYNPTLTSIDLSILALKLHIINSSGTDQNRALNFINTTIPSFGYFLIGPASGYTGSVSLDATYTVGAVNKLVDNGAVYISTSTATDKTGLIDLAGFGTASLLNREGSAAANLTVSTSLERKATSISTFSTLTTSGSEAVDGNGQDSNDNNSDFVVQIIPNPQNSLSAVEFPSLIKNGSFENMSLNNLSNWQRRSTISQDATAACSGNSSIKLTGSENSSQIYTFQTVQLSPNTKYTLSAKVKTQDVLGKGVSLRYAQLQPQVRVFGTGLWLNGTSDWKEIKIIFTTPANYASGRVDILWEMLPDDIAWVDDIKIKATPNATSSATPVNALVDNPSFESSYLSNNVIYPSRWWQRSTAILDSTNFHIGSSSAKLTGPQTGSSFTYSFQEVILEPNSSYQLSAYVKTQNVSGKGIAMRYAQLQPITKVFSTGYIRGTSDWQQISTTFTTLSNYESGRLDLVWDFQTGDIGWIDDVSLTKL